MLQKAVTTITVLTYCISTANTANASQDTATGNISARVVEELSITSNPSQIILSFGEISSASGNGTVTITPTPSGATRTKSGNVTLGNIDGFAATVNITGEPNAEYTINVSSPTQFLGKDTNGQPFPFAIDGITRLTVNNFQALSLTRGNIDSTGQINASGADTIHIGGDLTVTSATEAGIYEGQIDVTVSY